MVSEQSFPPDVLQVVLALPGLRAWQRIGGGLLFLDVEAAVAELVESGFDVRAVDAALSACIRAGELTPLHGSLGVSLTLQAEGTFPLWMELIGQRAKSGTGTSEDRSKEATANSRMIDTLGKRPQTKEWSVRQWADHLGCSTSTVHNTKTWATLQGLHEETKRELAERQRRMETGGA